MLLEILVEILLYLIVLTYLSIKIDSIRSRPYNPKAQGKVERSHKELCRKIYGKMVSLKNKEVSWVENLPNYVRFLNK